MIPFRIITPSGQIEITVQDSQEAANIRISNIKGRCALSIERTGLPWMVQREVSGGDPIPQSVKDECAAIREASNAKEAAINAIVIGSGSEEEKIAAIDLVV